MKTTEETTSVVIDRDPEIFVPDDLAPYYDAAYTAAEEAGVTQEGNPFWPLDVDAHCRWIVARRYDGVIPGTVRRPYGARVVGEDGVDTRGLDSGTYDEWVAAYRADQRADAEFGDEFRAEVEELKSSILRDPFRLLRLGFHFQALAAAKVARTNHDRAEASRTEYVRANTCPVCEQCDPGSNGPIMTRTLLDGTAPTAFTRHPQTAVRSCLACWNDAHAIHLERLSRATVDTRGRTRREVVTAHIASLTPTT